MSMVYGFIENDFNILVTPSLETYLNDQYRTLRISQFLWQSQYLPLRYWAVLSLSFRRISMFIIYMKIIVWGPQVSIT